MKFLIWLLCILVFTTANELLGLAIGFKVGYIILYALCAGSARFLCIKWDERKSNKKKSTSAAVKMESVKTVVPAANTAPAAQAIPKPPAAVAEPAAYTPVQTPVRPEAIAISEADRKTLKHRAVAYLPKNLEQTAAQRQIIQMLAVCVPSIRPCVEKAEREIWPKVEQNILPMNHAVAQCGNEINKLIGITVIENLKLETQSEEKLLKAWIALDYYSYLLKVDYSVNIRKLQDHIAVVLKVKKRYK